MAGVAIVLTALLAGCSEPKPPPPKPVAPAVSLSPKLIEQASAYRAYVSRAHTIAPSFANGGDVAQSLKTGAAYEPKQLLRGAIAYGAVAALQDPTFVAGVRTYAVDPQQRREMVLQIMRNPNYATTLPGADRAAGLVIAALGGEGERLYGLGKAVKQAAYDVQRQNWSKTEVANRAGRLAEAKALSAAPLVGDMAETGRLEQAAVGGAQLGLSGEPKTPPYSVAVVRSLAVAALAALGEAGDANVEQVSGLLVDPAASTCLNLSKLNLYQCLAVSKPHYEDVFCLGQHVLMDTGQCLIRSAGLPPPEIYKPVKVAESSAPSPAKASTKKR
ncbi:hypothetical protein [Phenylobacterium sp.]|uniref:hypothetical protein n=1 Tax=Phenylobacterium sp. TaxID=1871053 RepID=UPI00391981F7